MPSHTIAKVILTQTCVKFISCHAIPGLNRYHLCSVRLKDYFYNTSSNRNGKGRHIYSLRKSAQACVEGLLLMYDEALKKQNIKDDHYFFFILRNIGWLLRNNKMFESSEIKLWANLCVLNCTYIVAPITVHKHGQLSLRSTIVPKTVIVDFSKVRFCPLWTLIVAVVDMTCSFNDTCPFLIKPS